MRNAMNSRFLPYMPMESGGPLMMQIGQPFPTMASLPTLPAFSTTASFQPYQGLPMQGVQREQVLGPSAAPLNFMARNRRQGNYAAPQASPFGRQRAPSVPGDGGYSGYGGSTYGMGRGSYGMAGGFNPYENMF